MRRNHPLRQTRMIVCAAFALVVMMLGRGVARSQDEAKAPEAAATDAAPAADAAPADAATGAAPGTEGEAKEKVEDILKQAQEAMQKGDFQTAYDAYNRLALGGERDVTYSPQGTQLRLVGYTGRGQALAGMKEYDAALEEFKLALDLDDKFFPALYARGQMYLDIGNAENYGAAISDFQTVVKQQRGHMAALFGLGKALILTNNFAAGIQPLTKVIQAVPETDPKMAEAYRLRGMGNAGVYKVKEALEDLNKSLSLNPNDYETYMMLAALDVRLEDYQAAVDHLAKAIENYKPKDPEDKLPFVQGHITRASAFLEMGKKAKDAQQRTNAYESARQEVEKVLQQIDPKNPYTGGIRATALYWRGIAERMLGQLHQAVQTLSEAIELNPDFSEAYYRRGICYHYLGDDRLAIADFNEASNINFNDPRAALWLGFTHAKMGDYLDALRAYSDALAASDRYTPAFINRGLAYMALGEYEKALADFNDAVRLEPTNPDYYFKRGLAFEALNQSQKAAESFAATVEFNDKHAAGYRHLAAAMQRLGRNELATQYRQRATELEAPKQAQ